jgi:hypothetical protein
VRYLPSGKPFPGCSHRESDIVRGRAEGKSYWRLWHELGIAPRRMRDMEQAALKRIVRYLDQSTFLEGK